MTDVPEFAKLDEALVYDYSVKRTEITNVPCSQSTQHDLNVNASQLQFYFNGEHAYRISSPNTGFLVRYKFRTRVNNADASGADVTLASNWFLHMLSDAELKLGGEPIERMRFPGITTDVFYHPEEHDIPDLRWIKDTSTEKNNVIGSRTGDVAGGDAAAVVASVNLAANRSVTVNSMFNQGFVKRKDAYNYTVANNADYREGDIFIPLNRIFGFAAEVDRVLKFVPFEITLTRKVDNTYVFGAAGTGITFGDNNESGILSIVLQVERVTFRPDIQDRMEKLFKKPLVVNLLKRIFEEKRDQ